MPNQPKQPNVINSLNCRAAIPPKSAKFTRFRQMSAKFHQMCPLFCVTKDSNFEHLTVSGDWDQTPQKKLTPDRFTSTDCWSAHHAWQMQGIKRAHTRARTHTHTHTLAHSHSLSLSRPCAHTHTHSHTLVLSLSLSLFPLWRSRKTPVNHSDQTAISPSSCLRPVRDAYGKIDTHVLSFARVCLGIR